MNRILHNKQHLTPDVAKLNVLEIIDQPRLSEHYSDIAQEVSAGITIDPSGKPVPHVGASVNSDGVGISGYWSENVAIDYNLISSIIIL